MYGPSIWWTFSHDTTMTQQVINPDHWDSLTVISPPSELVPPDLPASAVAKDSPEMGRRCYSIYSPKKRRYLLKIDGWKMNCHFLMVPFWGRGGVEKIIGILSVHSVFLCFECWFLVEFQAFFLSRQTVRSFFRFFFPLRQHPFSPFPLLMSLSTAILRDFPFSFGTSLPSSATWRSNLEMPHLQIQLGDARFHIQMRQKHWCYL